MGIIHGENSQSSVKPLKKFFAKLTTLLHNGESILKNSRVAALPYADIVYPSPRPVFFVISGLQYTLSVTIVRVLQIN